MGLRIRFSHNYKKLNNEKSAVLRAVIIIDLGKQAKSFLEYDTEGIYNLPKKGEYIALIFLGKNGTLFTTLRRYTPAKYAYYISHLNDLFEILIENGGGK